MQRKNGKNEIFIHGIEPPFMLSPLKTIIAKRLSPLYTITTNKEGLDRQRPKRKQQPLQTKLFTVNFSLTIIY